MTTRLGFLSSTSAGRRDGVDAVMAGVGTSDKGGCRGTTGGTPSEHAMRHAAATIVGRAIGRWRAQRTRPWTCAGVWAGTQEKPSKGTVRTHRLATWANSTSARPDKKGAT
jgi:hypothetical protein